MRRSFFLLIIHFVIFPVLLCAADTGLPVVVDTRLLIMAHPLFKAFDTENGRFKGTFSEPIPREYQGIEDAVGELKELQDYLLKSAERLREKMKKIPLSERLEAERDFLTEKRTLESKLDAMKMRVYMAQLVPTKIGMTSISSIMPLIEEITGAIRKVTNTIKKKYKTDVVIDIASLLPLRSGFVLTENLAANKQKQIRQKKKGSSFDAKEYMPWLSEASSYWASRLGVDADIVPYGAVDVRLEALKLMEDEVKGYKLWKW